MRTGLPAPAAAVFTRRIRARLHVTSLLAAWAWRASANTGDSNGLLPFESPFGTTSTTLNPADKPRRGRCDAARALATAARRPLAVRCLWRRTLATRGWTERAPACAAALARSPLHSSPSAVGEAPVSPSSDAAAAEAALDRRLRARRRCKLRMREYNRVEASPSVAASCSARVSTRRNTNLRARRGRHKARTPVPGYQRNPAQAAAPAIPVVLWRLCCGVAGARIAHVCCTRASASTSAGARGCHLACRRGDASSRSFTSSRGTLLDTG